MAITNKIKFLENINDFSKVGLIYIDNSGENLLRYYLENIFHIKTGCNIKSEYLDETKIVFHPNDDVDSNWIVASDYPSKNEDEYINAEITSAILLVRNPVDLIMGKFIQESKYSEEALQKIDEMIDEWKQFVKYWIKSPIPVHLVRYEDLLLEPEEILKQLCKFLLGIKSIESTKLEYTINQITLKSSEIDQKYFVYDNVDDRINYMKLVTSEVSEKIQESFYIKLNKMLRKLNYELNENGELMNWMVNFNRENFSKMVEFHQSLNSQFLTSTFQVMRIS